MKIVVTLQELSSLCQEISTNEADLSAFPMMDAFNSKPVVMQGFIEDFVNLCAFHMWSGLLG